MRTSSMREFRYAFRLLARSPILTVSALLCLALGIGATTSIFTVVHAVLLRPLPYRNPEQLVRLYTEFPKFPNGGLRRFPASRPEFIELRRDLRRNWQAIEAWTTTGANLGGATEPLRVQSAVVSGGLLATLGVQPQAGRLLTPEDDRPGAPRTAVISHGLWTRAFGARREILNTTVQYNGQDCSIVGIMPPGFQFPPGDLDASEIWTPLQINPANPGNRAGHQVLLLGRLQPGASLAQGFHEVQSLVEEYGRRSNEKIHLLKSDNHPMVAYPLHAEVIGSVRPALLMLLAAVGFVLLIACVNVANLLLARAESRQREIAVRAAMGANSGALLRHFLAEGILLSVAGALLGLAFAAAGTRVLVAAAAESIPRSTEIAIDFRVLGFTLAVSLATGIFFGLAPLIHQWKVMTGDALKAASGRTTASLSANRLRKVLVAGELALALVLLIGTGLMVRAFWRLQAVDIGMRPQGLLTLSVALSPGIYGDGPAVNSFWSRAQDRIRTVPGVESVTFMDGLPPQRGILANDTTFEGFVRRPGGPLQNVDYYNVVGHNYFETMGVRLIDGRTFDGRDTDGGTSSVIVNQTLANVYWPNQSALGRRVKPSGSTNQWRTVVGVVADVKNAGIDRATGTELYLPFRQAPGTRIGYLVVRTSRDPASLARPVRAAIADVDAGLPISQVRTMEEVISSARARPRFLTLLLTIFSGVALTLAAIGLYGVMSYLVAQRTNEFGIRLAIGAEPHQVLRMVLIQGVRLGLAGVALGGVGAWALTRLLRGVLFGIESPDPFTFAAISAGLLCVTLLACFVPARRATQVDPLIALRYE